MQGFGGQFFWFLVPSTGSIAFISKLNQSDDSCLVRVPCICHLLWGQTAVRRDLAKSKHVLDPWHILDMGIHTCPKLLLPWFVLLESLKPSKDLPLFFPWVFVFQRCFVFCSPIFVTIFRLPFFSPSQGCQGCDKNSHDSDPLRSTWWNTQDQRHRCWAQKASHIGGRRSYWGTRHWPWRGKVAPSFFRCNGLDPFCNITSLFHRSTSRFVRKGFKDFERVWRKEKDEIEGEQRCTTLQSFYIHAMMKTLHQMQSSEVEKLGATD